MSTWGNLYELIQSFFLTELLLYSYLSFGSAWICWLPFLIASPWIKAKISGLTAGSAEDDIEWFSRAVWCCGLNYALWDCSFIFKSPLLSFLFKLCTILCVFEHQFLLLAIYIWFEDESPRCRVKYVLYKKLLLGEAWSSGSDKEWLKPYIMCSMVCALVLSLPTMWGWHVTELHPIPPG